MGHGSVVCGGCYTDVDGAERGLKKSDFFEVLNSMEWNCVVGGEMSRLH